MTEMQRYIQGAVAVPGVNITSHPRCGDADRQRAANRINEAYARGFIDKDEAEARRDAVGQCTLAAHLEELMRDIPTMTRFSGASLPTRTETRAQDAVKWWQRRQPWSSLVAMVVGLIEGIVPGVVTSMVDPRWAGPVAAMTIPLAGVVVIPAFCALMAWTVEL